MAQAMGNKTEKATSPKGAKELIFTRRNCITPNPRSDGPIPASAALERPNRLEEQ